MTVPAVSLPQLGFPHHPPAVPRNLDLRDPTTVYALTLLLLSTQRDMRGGGPIRRDGLITALRPIVETLGGALVRVSHPNESTERYAWLCDDARVRQLVRSAREDVDAARRVLGAIPEELHLVALLGAWDARGTNWKSAPGLAYAAIGGPADVLIALQEMLVTMGLSAGTLAARNDPASPDELRIGGDAQVAHLQALLMNAAVQFPASRRVRVREPLPRLRLHVRADDRTRVLRYPVPAHVDLSAGQTVIRDDAERDVRLLAAVLGELDGMHLLAPAERMWSAAVLLALAVLEPDQPWYEAERAWRTQADVVEWVRTRCELIVIQSRFSSTIRQLEALGLTERDDTRRRYRLSAASHETFARCGARRPDAARLALRLESALERNPQPQRWLALPAAVRIGSREVRELPRLGQSEVLAIALSHADLVWPTRNLRVLWLDEGRSEVLKDSVALEHLGLGARVGGGGVRPDLMLSAHDPETGRERLVVAEACASHGPVTRTRAEQLERFLEGLRSDVDVQLVTLVLREAHLDSWRRDLADGSWVLVAERLMTDRPALIPACVLTESAP